MNYLFSSPTGTMHLKQYQIRVLSELTDYSSRTQSLARQGDQNPADTAFYQATRRPYRPLEGNKGVPYVCLKVPTGGGKTLLATHALGLILDTALRFKDDTGI